MDILTEKSFPPPTLLAASTAVTTSSSSPGAAATALAAMPILTLVAPAAASPSSTVTSILSLAESPSSSSALGNPSSSLPSIASSAVVYPVSSLQNPRTNPLSNMSVPQKTPSQLVIEAIDALRGRKARPDEARISHWINRRYGVSKEKVQEILSESVRDGSVIRVKYKDSISYRNPAKFLRHGHGAPIRRDLPTGGELLRSEKELFSNPRGASTPRQAVRVNHQGPSTTISTVGPPSSAPIKLQVATSQTGHTFVGPQASGSSVIPIHAVKKVLRIVRQITLSSEENCRDGASIPAVVHVLHAQNKQGEFPEALVIRVLKWATTQGTVKQLPNGNYVLAAGSGTRRIIGSGRRPLIKAKAPFPSAALKHLNTMHTSSLPVTNASSSLLRTNATSDGTAPVFATSSTAYATVERKKPGPVPGRKRLLNSMVGRTGGGNGPNFQPRMTSVSSLSSANSSVQRGRPVSKRKKFKKTLGPDFLEPSDLGLQYLQNSFEPKCDHCNQPASRNKYGKHEEFLICKDCNFKAHPTCLKYSAELTRKCRESPWQCMYCKDCCRCDGSGDVESILFCDSCDKGYHMECHAPPLRFKPSGTWFCTPCIAERAARKQKGFVDRKLSTGNESDLGFEDENDQSDDGEWHGGMDYEDDNNFGAEVSLTRPEQKEDTSSKIFLHLQPRVEEIVEVYPNMTTNPEKWTVSDVETFIKFIGFPEQSVIFREQEIDGTSLLLLKRSDVLTGMDLKVGPALKIYGHLQRLQLTHSQQQTAPQTSTGEVKESQDVCAENPINGLACDEVIGEEEEETSPPASGNLEISL